MQIGKDRLLSYDEALKLILDTCRDIGIADAEEVALEKASNRYLAASIDAPIDLPQFDNSAVDGYAVRIADFKSTAPKTPQALELIGQSSAGRTCEEPLYLHPGTTIKVMTGAALPPGTEAVIMREFCRESEDSQNMLTDFRPSPGENIRYRGEELKKGRPVLEKGTRINPPIQALLATFGMKNISVHKKPSLSLISTGDELVEPGEPLLPGQIYESNSFGLKACLEEIGLEPSGRFIAKDNHDDTRRTFEKALEMSDIVISCGGISVGDRDLVKSILENELGAREIFWRVAIKPGKPVYFGLIETDRKNKLIFGLPGNPVSTLVTFALFVEPAIRYLMGSKQEVSESNFLGNKIYARLGSDIKKKKGRLDFLRGILNRADDGALVVVPASGQGSHMLSGLAEANCLIRVSEAEEYLPEGEMVEIQQLPWR